MPENFSFVLAAYGLSFGVIVIYLLLIWQASRKIDKNENENK
jgi:hypothetical protein